MEKKTGGRAHHAHALASNSTGGGAEEPRGREPRASLDLVTNLNLVLL